jgi:MoaA/NifB/PqqE/SkfB family radical SAM enzyme
MCYFSDDEKRKTLIGKMTDEDLGKIAKALFHRALKVQIGCGAEPTISKSTPLLIKLAKKYNVPYISLTTNGVLLTEETIQEYISEGLNEVTISMHGVKKETYEYFMTNSNYEIFCQSLKYLSDAKKKYPGFKIRINYTMNEDNFLELREFFDVFNDLNFDILQLRPIQKMGETAYNNFSHNKLEEMYDSCIEIIKKECSKRNITCIAPEKINIVENSNNINSSVVESTFCYISHRTCWRSDFDYNTDSYESYSKRKNLSLLLFKNIFLRKKNRKLNEHFNYDIS